MANKKSLIIIIVILILISGISIYLISQRPVHQSNCGDGICDLAESCETCEGDCETCKNQLGLKQIIPEKAVTGGDAKYVRPEIIVIKGHLYFAFEKTEVNLPKGEEKFELVELNKDLSYKGLSQELFSGNDVLSPHDIRLATDGTKLWYAFQTVDLIRSATCSGNNLNVVKYDSLTSPPIYNLNVNEISGCSTNTKDYQNPTGDLPDNPKAIDDPAPIYYNGEHIVITRAWNGHVQHVRKFDDNLNLIEYFTLDLGLTRLPPANFCLCAYFVG